MLMSNCFHRTYNMSMEVKKSYIQKSIIVKEIKNFIKNYSPK